MSVNDSAHCYNVWGLPNTYFLNVQVVLQVPCKLESGLIHSEFDICTLSVLWSFVQGFPFIVVVLTAWFEVRVWWGGVDASWKTVYLCGKTSLIPLNPVCFSVIYVACITSILDPCVNEDVSICCPVYSCCFIYQDLKHFTQVSCGFGPQNGVVSYAVVSALRSLCKIRRIKRDVVCSIDRTGSVSTMFKVCIALW